MRWKPLNAGGCFCGIFLSAAVRSYMEYFYPKDTFSMELSRGDLSNLLSRCVTCVLRGSKFPVTDLHTNKPVWECSFDRAFLHRLILSCSHSITSADIRNPLIRASYRGSKSDAGCLHHGQIKSSGSTSPSYMYPQITQIKPFFSFSCGLAGAVLIFF